jgi:hypothetical protein
MSMNKKLSRRYLLKGAGIALALPWLEAMSPRSAVGQPANAVKRFISIYMPNGASSLWWRTSGSGAGDAWQLSPLLSPFESLKQKMLLVRQLGNFTWRSDLLSMNPAWNTYRERNDFCGVCRMPVGAFVLPSHSRDPSALLNCVDGDELRRSRGEDRGSSSVNGETIDQLIVRSLAIDTPLSSMQLGLLDGSGGLDDRHSAMSRNMSWNQQGIPLGKDVDPRVVFDKLVAAGAGQDTTDPNVAEAAARRRAQDLSALDALADSTTQLQGRLGQSDKTRLDQFLTGVRELELKINNVDNDPLQGQCELTALPTDISQPELRGSVMNDLIVTAMKCDVTRVVTYMLDNSRSDLVYSWVPRRDFEAGGVDVGGTATSYHECQHHSGVSPDFASITHWHIQRAADLVQKLDAVSDGDGERTLLDDSVVLFMSAMHHGDHAAFDLPFTLFGGSGTFRQDELVALPETIEDIRQLRDVYFTILSQFFGLDIESFGDDMRGVPNQLVTELLA